MIIALLVLKENTFTINVPRPLSNDLWLILFQKMMRKASNERASLEHLHLGMHQ